MTQQGGIDTMNRGAVILTTIERVVSHKPHETAQKIRVQVSKEQANPSLPTPQHTPGLSSTTTSPKIKGNLK